MNEKLNTHFIVGNDNELITKNGLVIRANKNGNLFVTKKDLYNSEIFKQQSKKMAIFKFKK